MSKGKNILVAVVLAAAGLGYIWWAAEPAPMHTQAPGQGQGAGGGNEQIAAPASTAEQADSECGALLALYQGPNLLWQRTAAEVNAMAESRPIPGGHQTKMEALELLELARLTPGTALVEVVTCDNKVARFPVDKVAQDSRRFFVSANRREQFKLVELEDGVEQTMLRKVARISLKPDGQRRIEQ